MTPAAKKGNKEKAKPRVRLSRRRKKRRRKLESLPTMKVAAVVVVVATVADSSDSAAAAAAIATVRPALNQMTSRRLKMSFQSPLHLKPEAKKKSTKAKSKTKRKVDPNAPKRPANVFMRFSDYLRREKNMKNDFKNFSVSIFAP